MYIENQLVCFSGKDYFSYSQHPVVARGPLPKDESLQAFPFPH